MRRLGAIMSGELFLIVCEPVAGDLDGLAVWKVEISDMQNSMSARLHRDDVAEFVAGQLDAMMEWAETDDR
tara:strand:+ start:2336 stop:2548 length:213 start_codon:yes stop_codon:yes gene_type:complete